MKKVKSRNLRQSESEESGTIVKASQGFNDSRIMIFRNLIQGDGILEVSRERLNIFR